VFPTQLSRSGLEAALQSLVTRSGGSARFTATGDAGGRFAPRVETAVYFCCAEVIRGAGLVSVDLGTDGPDLFLHIVGVTGQVDHAAVLDRVEAVGGRLSVEERVLLLTVPGAVKRVDPSVASGEAPRGSAGVDPRG
jgi:hypothetical protein